MTQQGSQRILLSNLGYARGFSGSLREHLGLMHRHLWCPPGVQRRVLKHFRALMARTHPDICCLLEIDTGSFTSAGVNQLDLLKDEEYPFADSENKYHPDSYLRRQPFMRGKSNGFVARRAYDFVKLYFARGTKRLIYQVRIMPGVTLFFTHFSLNADVRKAQLAEMQTLARKETGEVILLGDFNVLQGLDELKPLLLATDFRLMNDPTVPTFFFYRHRLTLDLCLCSPALAERTTLEVIPQAFSDHAALLVEISA